MYNTKDNLSNSIYYFKAIAIFCVLLAHCCIWSNESQIGKSLSLVLKNLGTIGVAIFFVVSGFLFDKSKSRKKDFISFFSVKFKRICIPWFFSAVVFLLYIGVRHDVDFVSLLLNAIGIKSFYWYLAITIQLYIIYYFIYKCKKTYTIVAFLGTFSFCYPIMSFASIDYLMNFELNPIRWFFFFSAGICISYFYRNKKMMNIISSQFLKFFCLFLFVTVLFILWYQNISLSYKSVFYIPFASLGFISVLLIVQILMKRKVLSTTLIKIGKYSFGLYLYQMFPWTGLLVYIANKFNIPLLILLNPFICLFICVIELDVICLIFKRINKEKYVPYLLGIPVSEKE